MNNNKNQKDKFHLGFMLKVKFGFAEHQQKATLGLGYKLTLSKNTDNSVLNKENATKIGKINIISIERHVPHYTPANTH